MSDHHHPLFEMTRARLLEFVRDKGALFWTFGFPVVLAVALGIAFRESPPDVLQVGVAAAGPEAPAVAAVLDADDRLEAQVLDDAAADAALASGKIDLLVIPSATADWVYRYDEMRPDARFARLVADEVVQRSRGREDVIVASDDRVAEVGGRYIDFLIPGLIGLNIMGSAIWGIGFSVVDARRRKLLKRFAATPMRRSHFLLSYMLSRLVFLFAEVAVLVAFGSLVFGVHVRGSWLVLALLALWGALAFTGISLLIAARPRNTESASGWANLFMLPMWLLCGAFFSYERFPDFALPVIRALPLTALNDAMRGIINQGIALSELWPEFAVLAVWGTVCFTLALRLFRWQ